MEIVVSQCIAEILVGMGVCWNFGLFEITTHDKCISRIVSLNVCDSTAVKSFLYIAMSFRQRPVKDMKIRGLFQKNTPSLNLISPQSSKAWLDRIGMAYLETHALCVVVA